MKTMNYLFICCLCFFSVNLIAQDYEIYVSDAGNYNNPPWQIVKYDMNGENPVAFIDTLIVWPQDILFLEEDGIVLISNLTGNGYISKHDIETGEYLGNFAEGINGPTRMKIGPDNLLYVLQWYNGNNKVLRYQLDGTFVDEFTSIGVPSSIGLDWDAAGNLYVSTYYGKYVQKFDTDGNDLGAFINTNLSGPTNIWFDENGDLLVNDYLGASVKRFNSDGEYQGQFITGLFYPEGVAYLDNGNILIGNGGTHAVKMFDSNGNFLEDIVASGLGGLITPNAVVIREVPAVKVPENRLKTGLVIPSVGKAFYLNQRVGEDLSEITVFDITGNVVESAKPKSNLIWNADNHVNGVYFLLLQFRDGSQLTQKVVVR